ncbi:MAG: hypothetical protein MJH10_20480, partial [Epibacterium sp.]|nr:hypothetical protein [Epibacterium sp.]
VSFFERSCRPRWWLDVADGGGDLPNQRQVAVILVSVDTTQLSQPVGRISGSVGIMTRASP